MIRASKYGIASLTLIGPSTFAWANLDYHGVGWLNTFVPGAGQVALGNSALGMAQGLAEIGSFGWGYSLSAGSPCTLDGVPERIPSSSEIGPINITKSLSADILQEVGIKYHMVNVFNAYREAAKDDPNIDKTPTSELFLAPFRWSVLSAPEVYIRLAISFVAIAGNYFLTVKDGVSPIPTLTPGSNRLYALTYTAVYPVGSAAPEEMFYRGFLQNEFRNWVPSPWFAVPMSSLVFALSHSPSDMPSAAIAGLWLGTVSYLNHGMLSYGIAYHFWSDVLTGLMAVQLLQKAQFYSGPANIFNFSWYF